MVISKDRIEVNRQKVLNAFPINFKSDVESVIDFLIGKNFDIHQTVEQEIYLDGQKLIIPGRVYFEEPLETTGSNLSDIQQTILNCLYLRHHNGYIRQNRLAKLINKTDYFVTPFVFQLLGEYVIEIIEDISKLLNDSWLKNFSKFIKENPKYWMQTECRMISYWNEYYRKLKYPSLKKYIGYKIVEQIKCESTA